MGGRLIIATITIDIEDPHRDIAPGRRPAGAEGCW
jgi:hypothetical protein